MNMGDLQSNRILVIDDNESIHQDFHKILGSQTDSKELNELESELFGESADNTQREQFDIHSAFQGLEGVEAVRKAKASGQSYAVAFVDMRMPPGIDGLDTIEQIWQIDPDIEIIVCTAYSDHSWDDIIKRLGRSDRWLLLRKPFDSTEVLQLASALTSKWLLRQRAEFAMDQLNSLVVKRTAQLEQEMKQKLAAHQALSEAAMRDSLTGLPNRTSFFERLRGNCQRINEDRRYRFGVLFIDIDNFKFINDNLGHAVGDEVLKAVAEKAKDVLRLSADSPADDGPVSRLGGDEFVVLLEDLRSTTDAQLVAERLNNTFTKPLRVGGREIAVSVSIGVAVGGEDFSTEQELLCAADAAMYRAKSFGKGRVVRFQPAFYEEDRDRAQLAEDLHHALRNNEIFVVYEPIIDTRSGLISSFEALARWRHPTRGAVPPDTFIPIAEDTGLIVPIGEHILARACDDLKWWRESISVAAQVGLNINISKRQLLEPDIVDRVLDIVGQRGLDPTAINLEVTETAIMTNPERLAEVLDSLIDIGIGVHMDDFGTGLSSLGYLQQFPFGTIKIDRGFIAQMEDSKRHAAIVRAIVTMAQGLGISTIAEGVETVKQLERLNQLQCEFVQGHYFSLPVDRDGALKLLADGVTMKLQHADRKAA